MRVLKGGGLVLALASLEGLGARPHTSTGDWLHSLALGQYGFIAVCAWIPWYGWSLPQTRDRYLGIRLHFWKVTVPAAYLAVCHIPLYILSPHWVIPLIANLLCGAITSTNLILLYLHYKDPHLEPPNLYSTGRYT